jgi:hypothetical protein
MSTSGALENAARALKERTLKASGKYEGRRSSRLRGCERRFFHRIIDIKFIFSLVLAGDTINCALDCVLVRLGS